MGNYTVFGNCMSLQLSKMFLCSMVYSGDGASYNIKQLSSTLVFANECHCTSLYVMLFENKMFVIGFIGRGFIVCCIWIIIQSPLFIVTTVECQCCLHSNTLYCFQNFVKTMTEKLTNQQREYEAQQMHRQHLQVCTLPRPMLVEIY